MAQDWKKLTEEARQTAVEANGFRVEFGYWEDSLLGGFYDPARRGDVPVHHLTVYVAGGEGWEPVVSCPTRLDLSTPWRTVFYWAEKVLKALEKKCYLEAAAVCPFAETAAAVVGPEKEGVAVVS